MGQYEKTDRELNAEEEPGVGLFIVLGLFAGLALFGLWLGLLKSEVEPINPGLGSSLIIMDTSFPQKLNIKTSIGWWVRFDTSIRRSELLKCEADECIDFRFTVDGQDYDFTEEELIAKITHPTL